MVEQVRTPIGILRAHRSILRPPLRPRNAPDEAIFRIAKAAFESDFARAYDPPLTAKQFAFVVREPYEFDEMPGSAIATLADPDGNYFQLTSPMEMAPQ